MNQDESSDNLDVMREKVRRLEKDVDKLQGLQVRLLVITTLAGIFGVTAIGFTYKLWAVWDFVADSEMRVVIRTTQAGGKLFRIGDDRRLIADVDPADAKKKTNESAVFYLQDARQYE